MAGVKQVIVIRKDLKMRRGKEIAQGAHASWKSVLDIAYRQQPGKKKQLVIEMDDELEQWLTGNFKKVTVYVNSEAELIEVYNRAKSAGLLASIIVDAGLTEFGGTPTKTAVAIGPAYEHKFNGVTDMLTLY